MTMIARNAKGFFMVLLICELSAKVNINLLIREKDQFLSDFLSLNFMI